MKKSVWIVGVCVLGLSLLFGLRLLTDTSSEREAERASVEKAVTSDEVVVSSVENAEEIPIEAAILARPEGLLLENEEAKSPAIASERYRFKAGNPFSKQNSKDRFPHADVVEMRESDPDNEGRITRTRLVRTNFKYPLIRVEERVQTDDLAEQEEIISQQSMVADHVMVRVQPGVGEIELSEMVGQHGYVIRKKMYAPDMYLVEMLDAGLDSIDEAVASLRDETAIIKYAEADCIVHALGKIPDDAQFDDLWGMHNTGQGGGTPDADIDAAEAWEYSTGSNSILVAVIDTGIDYTHEDLSDNIWTNPGEAGALSNNGADDDGNGLIDDFRGWDFYNNDNNPMDDDGHGTHCAGTIGAVGNNQVGVAGVCWNVSLVGLKILGSDGYLGSASDAFDATVYAESIGVRVMNNSWGGEESFSEIYQEQINAMIATWSNVLYVAAAGNDYGNDNDVNGFYPASYTNDGIIAVASSTRNDGLSTFSNYGSTSVDLAAPGSGILSTVPNDQYDVFDGTSMAAPHVSGAIALLWSIDPSLSPLEVRAALLDNVDTKSAFAGKMVSDGRLNVHRMIRHYAPTSSADLDGDSLPNYWETQYYGGLTNANPSATCSNGVNTVWQAYVAGLNPTNPASCFELSNLRNILQWEGVSGRVYSVWWTSNLLSGDFLSLGSNIPWTGNIFTDTTYNAEEKGFYKIDVELE